MKKSRRKRKQMRKKTRKRRKRRHSKIKGGGCLDKYVPPGGYHQPGIVNNSNGGYYKGFNQTTCHPDALDSTMASSWAGWPSKVHTQKGGFFFPSNLAELGTNIKEIVSNTYNRLNTQKDVTSYDTMKQDKLVKDRH